MKLDYNKMNCDEFRCQYENCLKPLVAGAEYIIDGKLIKVVDVYFCDKEGLQQRLLKGGNHIWLDNVWGFDPDDILNGLFEQLMCCWKMNCLVDE